MMNTPLPCDRPDLSEPELAGEAVAFRHVAPKLDALLSGLLVMILLGSCGLIASFELAAGSDWRVAAGMAIGLAGAFAFLMLATVRIMWVPTARRFPARPILNGAVARSGQFLAIGALCRFNGCITAVTDREHLHLVPVAAFRWFGARRMSLPWCAIENVRPFLWPIFARAEVGGTAIVAPAWCLKPPSGANGADETTGGSTGRSGPPNLSASG